MNREKLNGFSVAAIVVLSLIALVTVLTGYFQPPQPDEGAAAHIFQLSIVALFPAAILFVATAGRKSALRHVRTLALSAVTLAAAFGALYYLEYYR